ncbi:TFIIB-type zinc ribbon-containing protein [Haloactinospora alba]|nr:zf-TFIIB domain-containing protein [Haloactinospora alba]
MSELTCPKCPGSLSTQTLVGVTIDQCGECRGIFLDRGELEELIEAEHKWSQGQDPEDTRGRRRRDDGPDSYEPSEYQGERRKVEKDFLDEIFD